MFSSIYLKIVLVMAAAASIGLAYVNLSSDATPHPSSSRDFTYPMRMNDFTIKTSSGNKLVRSVMADEFKIKPRKFFIFNIRPFNEVLLTNVNLKLFIYEKEPPEMEQLFLGEEILRPVNGSEKNRGTGLITRGVINGLAVEVYKSGKLSIIIKAGKVYIDFSKNTSKMIQVTLEDRTSNTNITAGSALWDSKENIILIPGEYTILSSHGSKKGQKIKVDLDFNVSAM